MADATTQDFITRLQDPSTRSRSQADRPNDWVDRPQTLLTKSSVHAIAFGTGYELFKSQILPAVVDAQHEVVLVTCFWARSSETRRALSDALRALSARAIRRNRVVRVRLCFSSCSLMQKVFHTRSLRGQYYSPHRWKKQLGLPEPHEIPGLDMTVKSIFVLPFSVMHPKFVIVDRHDVLLPSCNVSWEDWFEGCIRLSGEATASFMAFYQRFWSTDDDMNDLAPFDGPMDAPLGEYARTASEPPTSDLLNLQETTLPKVPTVFLPSPHHVNPRFAFPWQRYRRPPPTPLNIYLMTLFARAEKSIVMQTPNLTAPPVLDAIKDALERGVDVNIITSERLMILEQLVTAGTTTSRRINDLIRYHESLVAQHEQSLRVSIDARMEEVARVGRLKISYYEPQYVTDAIHVEPTQSHLKLTMVDGRVTVLGSGNMDRASWYTSQELGLAFVSTEVAHLVETSRDQAMLGRTRKVYDRDCI